MNSEPSIERRRNPRLAVTPLGVVVRVRGRLGTIQAAALDFNRHGIAVLTSQALGKDRTVFVSLQWEDVRLENLVGVVHNCTRQEGQFRNGIRFRPLSDLQRDRRKVEVLLAGLEAALSADADNRQRA